MNSHECEDICTDHWEEDELICPYCLGKEEDSWAILRLDASESGKKECYECNMEYEYGTTITYRDGGVERILYTTYQLAAPKPPKEGE